MGIEGEREKEWVTKGPEETFGVINALPDCSDGSTVVYICQN